MKIIKQKRMFNLDLFSFATEDIKDAKNTMTVMKSANKELKGSLKTKKIMKDNNKLWKIII